MLFEVSMHGFTSNKGSFYEIMINDVTKTKLLEEQTLKDKCLILGKISHEFKNPLLVVDEVINQVIENYNYDNSNSKHKNKIQMDNLRRMSFAKNICNYMVILVKDFEVVASLENSTDILPNIDSLVLNAFLIEVQQIIETLIKKKEANNLVFRLTINRGLEIIQTDQTRLKQILINLLSNSVKFTEIGSIELSVDMIKPDNNCQLPSLISLTNLKTEAYMHSQDFEYKNKLQTDTELKLLTEDTDRQKEIKKAYIRFSVSDSGKGISENLVNLINSDANVKVFQKDNSSCNKLGTGYGLNIVQKLCKVLGSKLYASNKQSLSDSSSGSVFYFDLPYEETSIIQAYEVELKYDPAKIKEKYNLDDDSITFKEYQEYQVHKIQEHFHFKLDDKLVFDKFSSHEEIQLYHDKYYSQENYNFNPLSPKTDSILKKNSISISQIPLKAIEYEQDLFQTRKLIYDIKLPKKFLIDGVENYNTNIDKHNQTVNYYN